MGEPGKKLDDFAKGSQNTGCLTIDGASYFVVKYTKDNWMTIGISTLENFQKVRQGIIRNGFIYGGLSLCLGVGIVYILLNSVVRKLRELQESMNKVANGGVGYQLLVNGEDDISQLAKTFNYMSNRISELLEEVVQKERARKDMEIEVLDYKYRCRPRSDRTLSIMHWNASDHLQSCINIRKLWILYSVSAGISAILLLIQINSLLQWNRS